MEDKKEIRNGKETNSEAAVQKINGKFFMILGMLLLLQLGIICYCAATDLKAERKTMKETEKLTVCVEGSEARQERLQESEGQEKETQKQIFEESRMEEEQFLSMIFDEKGRDVGKRQLKISCLSAGVKEQLSFREADFITELTGFLQEQKMEVSEIRFKEEIMTSAESVSGYQIEILGKENLQLLAFFFPKLPGQYLFAVSEKEEQISQENSDLMQVMQTEISVPVQNQSETAETVKENPYDATTLSITGIPEKLLNYLDNRYELQYSLYDYLYKNGYRDVKKVSVESYAVTGDEQKAEIIFSISDGETVKGIYSKENNTYLFY